MEGWKDRWKGGQTLFHRNLPATATGPIFDDDLVAIHKTKTTLTLNKPAFVGMCILELSKVSMHDFHYDHIKNKYGKK